MIHRAHVIRAYARGVGRTIQEIENQPVPKGPHRGKEYYACQSVKIRNPPRKTEEKCVNSFNPKCWSAKSIEMKSKKKHFGIPYGNARLAPNSISKFVEFALSILMLKLNFPLPCCSKLYFISFIYFSFFYNHSPFPMSIKLLLWLPPWERVVQHCRSYCFVSGKCGTPCSIVFQCQGPRAWLGRSIPGQIPW